MRKVRFSLMVVALLLAGAADAARERISLEPEAGVYSEADIEKEIIFGREMAAIILADNKLSSNFELNRYINLVGQSLLRNVGRPELYFHFGAIESEQINAYAAPGGYIFVTTKALSLMTSEAELAGVLAHEIAHVADRHIVRALKIRADEKSTADVFAKIIGGGSDTATVVFEQAVGEAIELLFSKGLKIEDEIDADRQGIILTALAGYDPRAYYQYLQRIMPMIEENQGQLSRTHPPFSERITRLKKIIGSEGLETLGSYINQSRFRQYQ